MVRSITRLFINVVQAAVLLCIFAFPACAEPIYSGNGSQFMQEFQQDYADICHRSISKPDVSLSEDGAVCIRLILMPLRKKIRWMWHLMQISISAI